jgi:phage-related protein
MLDRTAVRIERRQPQFSMYRISFYTSERNESPVKEFLADLEEALRRRLMATIELLAAEGPNLRRRPHADTVHGAIRELRARIGAVRYRILYFFLLRDAIVLVHSFKKKSDAISAGDIAIAERRMQEYRHRYDSGRIKL